MKKIIFIATLLLIYCRYPLSADSCSQSPVFQLQNMPDRYARSGWVPKISVAYRYKERASGLSEQGDLAFDEGRAGFGERNGQDDIARHRVLINARWDLERLLGFFPREEQLWKHSQKHMAAMRQYSRQNDLSLVSLDEVLKGKKSREEFMADAKEQLQQEFLLHHCAN